jgi:hypothetical protein
VEGKEETMNCPNCKTKMESEAAPIAKFIGSAFTGVTESLTSEKSTPGMHYACHDCDSEWVWYKNRPKPRLRMLDGGNDAIYRKGS